MHLEKHGQRGIHDSRNHEEVPHSGDVDITPGTDPSSAAAAHDGTEHAFTDLWSARSEHKRALDSFRRAERHWRACSKKRETAVGDKGRGGKGGAVERHAAEARREALQRTQKHMQMLDEASQVLTCSMDKGNDGLLRPLIGSGTTSGFLWCSTV